MITVSGGVCAPKGFLATGIHAGIRKNPQKKDLALIYSQTPCTAAGVTTQNKTVAAPVLLTREHLESSAGVQAILCNSGNANACTATGMQAAAQMCASVAETLDLKSSQVLVASTGVIGQELDTTPIVSSMPTLVETLSTEGSDACAQAIMTTDTQKKEVALRYMQGETLVTIGGISKGSGMIHPNMATMLGFVTTDVSITKELLNKAVVDATNRTFNMVSVDGDTSTNDMVLVLANGQAGATEIAQQNEAYENFYKALLQVFETLAIAIASDGEGATKLLTCQVSGATDLPNAQQLAKAVIASNLVKAAMFGADANWGRVICAMGYSGADFIGQQVSISFSSSGGEVTVCQQGKGIPFDEALALEILTQSSIEISIVVGNGPAQATAWGCDLTYDYVKINGEYRS